MSCNCNKAINTGACVANFTVGIATANTNYKVLFRTPTGRVDIYALTSASNGTVVVDSPQVRIGELYEVWLNLPGDPFDKKLSFMVGETSVTCINIQFTECFEDDEYLSPIDQTVELE
jgi:hypothetical protein